MNIRVTYLILSLILIVMSSNIGCNSTPTSLPYKSPYNVPDGKYIFIEHEVKVDGVILEGTYSGPQIDFPTYSYDSTQGILQGMINFPVTDNLVGVYGDGMWLTGAAGGGRGSEVDGIYKLPYQRDPIIVTGITADGSVSLRLQDAIIILAGGKEWKTITSQLDTTMTGIALLTTTERITNYGFQLKSKIHAWGS